MRDAARASARLWWGLPVLVVVLWAYGAFALRVIPGLPAPPEATVWLLPALRFARDLAASLTVGALVIGGLLGPVAVPRALGWARGWALAWLALLGCQALLTASDVLAAPLGAGLDDGTVLGFLSGATVGQILLGQAILVLVVALGCDLGARRMTRPGGPLWIVAVLGGAACALPSVLGHGGLSADHVVATISLAGHYVAIAAWLGGLIALVALARRDPAATSALLPRFSVLALWCVIVAAETGLLNASLRLGGLQALVGTDYGSLVLAKAVLLALLVRLGWTQRRRVISRLEDGPVLPTMARIAGSEALVMGVAVALAVALARLGPTAPGPTASSFTPLSAVLLSVAIPIMLATWRRRPTGRLGRAVTSYPEAAAVLLLVVLTEVVLLDALDGLLGASAGTALGVALLIGAGWLLAVALLLSRSAVVAVIVMVGVAVILAASATGVMAGLTGSDVDSGGGSLPWRQALIAGVVAEAILMAVLRVIRRPEGADATPAAVPVAG